MNLADRKQKHEAVLAKIEAQEKRWKDRAAAEQEAATMIPEAEQNYHNAQAEEERTHATYREALLKRNACGRALSALKVAAGMPAKRAKKAAGADGRRGAGGGC